MLFVDVVFIFVESVDDFVHIVTDICSQSWIFKDLPSCGVDSSKEASRLSRVMCSLAYWILLNKSFPFILTSNKYIARAFSYTCPFLTH